MSAAAAVAVTPSSAVADSAARALRLESLRALLPAPLPQAPGLPTGIEALDAALAARGLPRGRLTQVAGASGKLTLMRRIVDSAAERGEWVAYIDASRTLAARDWAHLAHVAGVWIVRPPDAGRAAWCADVLLRSAAFSLVVLDSAPPLSRSVSVRLMGLARESNAALVIVAGGRGGGAVRGDDGTGGTGGIGQGARWGGGTKLGGAVRLRVHRRRQRLRIAIEKGAGVAGGAGENGRLQTLVEVSCANGVARRLCTHPEVPDRRAAARAAAGRPGKGRRAATPSYDGGGGILQYR